MSHVIENITEKEDVKLKRKTQKLIETSQASTVNLMKDSYLRRHYSIKLKSLVQGKQQRNRPRKTNGVFGLAVH
jgi:hypothetical protein